jgi:glycosyltransferase involved in cell wall biosynthesis
MTTYQGERHLKAQLHSLAEQDLLPLEVQIGDDGSSDGTEDIVRAFAIKAPFPVHFTRNENTLGYGENFLRTALRCRGDWIAFCDQDDIWSTVKLSRVAEAIGAAPPSVMLIAHNARIVDEHGRSLDSALLERLPDRVHRPFALPATWLCAGFRQVFRRTLMTDFDINNRIGTVNGQQQDGGFDSLPHDSWIPFLANMTGQIRTLSADLVDYRRHGSNATAIRKGDEQAEAPLGNNASTYRHHAQWHTRAAEVLILAAASPANSSVQDGRKRLLAEAEWLERRAQLYEASRLSHRLRLLQRQLSSGGYRASWGLSKSSLAKDLLFAFGGKTLLDFLARAR